MTTAVAVFTRDLRVHDNPVLAAAATDATHVVPLFVLDDKIGQSAFAGPLRWAFLAESLADLDASLRGLGARLVVRAGDTVEQVCRVAADVGAARVHIASDVSGLAGRREAALRRGLAAERRDLCCHEEVHTVVAAGRITPANRDHFSVFTPYHRRWQAEPWRRIVDPPARLSLPAGVDPGHPAPTAPGSPLLAGRGRPTPDGPGSPLPGGETAGRRRAGEWLDLPVRRYADLHDDLAADATSRLSAYLHLGCVSALELARSAGRSAGAAAFVRQLAWRDFHHQVLAARPSATHDDYRGRGDRWHTDHDACEAWRQGRTGVPIVDAGMRQLRAEGWMHNRARLITGSFLTKTLYLDWRLGAAHFFEWLVDGDLANNCMNWQWIAGTGTDTRPNRLLSPLRQALRFDPTGDYVRRYVPELSRVAGPAVHRPWALPGALPASRRPGALPARRGGGPPYPAPIVDLDAARERFLRARSN